MAGVTLHPNTEETRKALQEAARHEFIFKLYNEILVDMTICDIEGWDKTEYINMLYDVLNHFKTQLNN